MTDPTIITWTGRQTLLFLINKKTPFHCETRRTELRKVTGNGCRSLCVAQSRLEDHFMTSAILQETPHS